MATYFAVMDRVSNGQTLPQEEWEGAKLVGELEAAKVQKVEASSTKAAVDIVQHFFGGDIASRTVIVTEAQFKEEGA